MCDFDNLDYGTVREMFDAEFELDLDDARSEVKDALKDRIKEAIKNLPAQPETHYTNGEKDALETVLSWL